MGKVLGRLLILLLLLAGEAVAQDFIREELIPSTIPRNSQLIPTGETNAICVANTPGPAPALSLCSTVNVTGKTVLYKIPEYAFASIPAGTPLVIVTNSGSSSVCNGSGSTKVPCWHNGTSWTPLGAGGGATLPIDLASQVSGLLPAANANNAIIHASAAYCADAGASDTYACNLTPAPASYVTGARYRFKANTANTGVASINFNSLGPITIKKAVGGVTTDLVDFDIRANQIVEVVFDGTNMQMQSTLGNAGGGLGALSEDADSVNATKTIEVGNCATNCWSIDASAVTGTKTFTIPNANTVPVQSTTQTAGQYLTHIDSSGAQNKSKLFSSAQWDGGSITPDGTNCADPTKQTLNSGPTVYAFSCAASAGSVFYGQVELPVNVTTVTFRLTVFHGTTETITFAGDFSAQCRAAGTAPNNTWGTAVAADVAITTANLLASATTTAVTPNGSCTSGATLFWRYAVDAGNFSANAANSKVIGVFMERAS